MVSAPEDDVASSAPSPDSTSDSTPDSPALPPDSPAQSASTPAQANLPAQAPADLPPSIPPRNRPAPSVEPSSSKQRRLPSAPILFLAVLLIAALFKTFVLQTYAIPSGSMADTLITGDQVAVTRYDTGNIQRGDIVVFTDPDNWLDVTEPTGLRGLAQDALEFMRLLPADTGHHIIKRVIGVPGDHVVAEADGSLSVNGVKVQEPYLKPGSVASTVTFDVVVPAGHVWVMGDNRTNSADSRFHRSDANGGFVPNDHIVGVAKSVIWPVGRWGGLTGGRQAFAEVTQAPESGQESQ